jgi:hypothetical protein
MTIEIVNVRMSLLVLIVGRCLPVLFLCYGVDFRDFASRELDDRGLSFVGLIRSHRYVDTACFCLLADVLHLG